MHLQVRRGQASVHLQAPGGQASVHLQVPRGQASVHMQAPGSQASVHMPLGARLAFTCRPLGARLACTCRPLGARLACTCRPLVARLACTCKAPGGQAREHLQGPWRLGQRTCIILFYFLETTVEFQTKTQLEILLISGNLSIFSVHKIYNKKSNLFQISY